MSANSDQIGGAHYRSDFQHWDFVERNGLGYLEGCATKYVTRWRKKNGRQDLEKALHYTRKLLELAVLGERQPRGHADAMEVVRFGAANELTEEERVIVLLLANWREADDLRAAREAIQELLETA